MLLFPVALGGGVAIGLLRGGRLGLLASLPLRGGLLVGFAVGLQVVLGFLSAPSRPALIVLSYALIGAWLVFNALDRPPVLRVGIALIGLGWGLNAIVMVANGGMPVSTAALAAIEETGRVDEGHLWKHVEADAETRLRLLGDSIAVPVTPFRSVISIGDVVMLSGVGLTAAAAMGTRRRTRCAIAPG